MADLSHTVLSHVDRTIFDDDKLLQLARRGCYLEFDLFGIECSHYQASHVPSAYVYLMLLGVWEGRLHLGVAS